MFALEGCDAKSHFYGHEYVCERETLREEETVLY